ncbi:MAG: hypothetical protein JWO89_225 [Verrucomicrobiaceae bacterium]|nr:hypothetical protein [Verrucomicrobiaceae bacterium]
MSPNSFELPDDIKSLIARLGPALRAFQSACNRLYFESAESTGPLAWVAALVDQGKPPEIIELGRHSSWRDALPSVIRPDLVMTETGVCISELDSLPGGMGLTGWLNQSYASLGDDVLGGPDGMIDGFAAAFPTEDILISKESSDYQPEMDWIVNALADRELTRRRVLHTSAARPQSLHYPPATSFYRFFELWDLDNVEHSQEWLRLAREGRVNFTPPLKAFLEEKLWLALFWTPQLQDYWLSALGEEHVALFKKCIPQGWVVNPAPQAPFSVLPGLNIHSWEELRHFGHRARELVLKISGFSEKGWGSRGVFIGHDMPQAAWSKAIDEALKSYPRNPFLLQRFYAGRVVPHPTWNDDTEETTMMQSRVRLCPYYFVPAGTDDTQLGGVLATVCPSDKKILHGMRDAMMLPCV